MKPKYGWHPTKKNNKILSGGIFKKYLGIIANNNEMQLGYSKFRIKCNMHQSIYI